MDSSSLNELQQLIKRHGKPHTEPVRALPNLSLMAFEAATQPFAHVVEPVFAVVAMGRKQLGLGGKKLEYGSGQYLIVSVDLPLDAHAVVEATSDAPFLGLSFKLQPAAIAALLLDSGAAGMSRVDSPGLAISELTRDLIDSLVRLIQLLDQPADLGVLAPSIEREILWRLINGQQGAMVRQIGIADSRMARIGRAIRWIRNHYADAILIDDLAQIAGMSVTSLHRHFRGVTSMTPIQFQKQIRLQTARTRLLSAPEDVASVGLAVGYDSASQFSREYRRLFGRPPGQDRQHLRSSQVQIVTK